MALDTGCGKQRGRKRDWQRTRPRDCTGEPQLAHGWWLSIDRNVRSLGSLHHHPRPRPSHPRPPLVLTLVMPSSPPGRRAPACRNPSGFVQRQHRPTKPDRYLPPFLTVSLCTPGFPCTWMCERCNTHISPRLSISTSQHTPSALRLPSPPPTVHLFILRFIRFILQTWSCHRCLVPLYLNVRYAGF